MFDVGEDLFIPTVFDQLLYVCLDVLGMEVLDVVFVVVVLVDLMMVFVEVVVGDGYEVGLVEIFVVSIIEVDRECFRFIYLLFGLVVVVWLVFLCWWDLYVWFVEVVLMVEEWVCYFVFVMVDLDRVIVMIFENVFYVVYECGVFVGVVDLVE